MKTSTLSLVAATACAVVVSTATPIASAADDQWSYNGYYDDDNDENDWYYDTYDSDYELTADGGQTWDAWGVEYYDGYYDENTGDDWYYDGYAIR